MPTDQRDVPDAGVEAAMPGFGDFAEIGDAGSVFSALAQTLQDAGDRQDHGRPDPDRRVGRRHGHEKRAEAHHQDRDGERRPAAMPVREVAEDQAADRPHEEGNGEQRGGRELLHDGVALREEGAGEIKRERRIGVDVIPFEQIAERGRQDGANPLGAWSAASGPVERPGNTAFTIRAFPPQAALATLFREGFQVAGLITSPGFGFHPSAKSSTVKPPKPPSAALTRRAPAAS